MAKNDFKAFATGKDANVLKQTEYEELPALEEGFQSGIARSEELNKVWRQASTIASVIASFMEQQTGKDVLDNGDLKTLQETLLKALLNNSISQLDDRYLNAEANLSDLKNSGTARKNLNLGNSATLNVGTTPGTVAAGNDTRIVRAVQRTGDKMTGALISSCPDTYRITTGEYGTFWRNNGKVLYLMNTNKGDPLGSYNDHRPFFVDLQSGNASMGHDVNIWGSLTLDKSALIKGDDFITKCGCFDYTDHNGAHRQTNGLRIQATEDISADIYHHELIDKYHELMIHTGNGAANGLFKFRNDGSLNIEGNNPVLRVENAEFFKNGDISGSIWGEGNLSKWLKGRTHSWTNGEQGWWKDENTGLIFQWTVGPWLKGDENMNRVNFPLQFPRRCCTVNAGTQSQGNSIYNDAWGLVYQWDVNGCSVQVNQVGGTWGNPIRAIIFAIGV